MIAWSKQECEKIVSDYIDMLQDELNNAKYNKKSHREHLLKKLINRTDGSIEYKHQNISAILIESGYPYISGYKPAFNYQGLLKETVVDYMSKHDLMEVTDKFLLAEPEKIEVIDWTKVLTDAPEAEFQEPQLKIREFAPKKYNVVDRERINRKLGILGEEFVLDFERNRLITEGREDLAKEVEWTSKDKGDGAGYDIRSFSLSDERELFIEVKTTKLGKYLPFYISENEVEFSKLYSDQYSLYRVFDYSKVPKMFMLNGNVTQRVNLQATTYRASF